MKTAPSLVLCSYRGTYELPYNRSLKNWETGKTYDSLDGFDSECHCMNRVERLAFFACRIDCLPGTWKAVLELCDEYALE